MEEKMPLFRTKARKGDKTLGSWNHQSGSAQLIFYDPYRTRDTELYGSFTSDLIPGFWVALYFELARPADGVRPGIFDFWPLQSSAKRRFGLAQKVGYRGR